MLLACQWLAAQTNLRIFYKDGGYAEIPLADIDSLCFADGSSSQQQATLSGQWLWGNRERGYYELLSLASDNTYTGYDNYFTYGFDTQTFGFYSTYGSMLTLWSNGYGYQWRYQWFIANLTQNALSVVTRTGPYTYYRLKPEVIHLTVNGSPLSMGEDTKPIFTDGVTVSTTEEGLLQPLQPGTTYILGHTAASNQTWGYKVVVE